MSIERRLNIIRAQLNLLEMDLARGKYYDGRVDVDRHADAISPNVPEGYDTVLGYLAYHHPDVLDTFDYRDPCQTTRDGYKLMHLARIEGAPVIWVEAPPCLREAGIDRIRAYPVEVLAKRGW